MIRLEGVRASFGRFRLEVSLEAPRGSYLTLLGPSGCGKSLLLGAVAGLYAVEEGRILLDDKDVTREPPERRGVGFVFQKTSLFPHLSVEENVGFGLRARGLPAAERGRRVEELVTLLDLSRLLDRPPQALSGGEAQRVALARALAPRPTVLLLDEPLSLVDHNARLELQELLRRVHRDSDLTVLHVTHNREEARALGQRVAVLLGGRIVQSGTLEEILARPRCLFVSRFLGLTGEPPPTPEGCTERCLGGSGECDRPYLGEP